MAILPYAAPIGGELLGALAEWAGGGDDRKRYKQDRNRVIGQIGKKAFDPSTVGALAGRKTAVKRKRLGANIDRRMGLDTGAGQGALAEQLLSGERDALMQALIQEAIQRSSRDANLSTSLLAGSAARR